MNSYAGDVTPQEAWDMLVDDPEVMLVDVRTSAEWRFVGTPDLSSVGGQTEFIEWVGYPDGAPNEAFVDQLREAGAKEGRTVLFLCRSGQRSIGAAMAATDAGFGPAYNVLEGFEGALDGDGHRGAEGWKATGLPWRQG